MKDGKKEFKEWVRYEHTERYYKMYLKLEHTNKQPAKKSRDINWIFPPLYNGTCAKYSLKPDSWNIYRPKAVGWLYLL